MSKFLSGRQSNLKLGVAGYTENKTVLETTGRVGIGTTNAESFSLYVVGPTNITGIATFKSNVFIDDQLFVGGVNITGGASIGQDVSARNLLISGISTFQGSVHHPDDVVVNFGDSDDLKIYHDSNGQSYIKDVGTGDLNLTSDGSGIHLQSGSGETLARFYTDGASLLYYDGQQKLSTSGIGVTVTGRVDADSAVISGNLDVDGTTELDGLNVDGATTLDATTVDGLLDINAGGQANTFKVEDLTDNRIVLAGSGGELEDSANLTFDGATLDVTGHTELDQLRVAGVSTFAGNVDISSNGNLTVAGNLIVQGTQTQLNTTALEVEDINIGIASATPKLSNAALDGAGITIHGSQGDKTLTWSNANSRMEFNTDLYSPNFFVGGITATGDVDFDGNLDVDGHTELDQLRVSGVSTFQGNVDLGDDDILRFGDDQDLQIYHDGTNSYIREGGTGALRVGSSRFQVKNPGDSKLSIDAFPAGEVILYYNNSKKFETTGYGATVYNDLNVGTGVTIYGNAGIVSAISFYGDGSNLTNTGATLSATSGVERLVTTQLTSGTMVDAATDADLTFDATTNTLNTDNIKISGGISTNGTAYGQQGQLLQSTGSGWQWRTVPGLYSVNNILNGFNVLEEGGTVGTAGSIHTLDFRGINVTASADPQPNGIATVTFSPTPTFTDITVTGNTTIPNVVGVTTFASDIDVDGLTELDDLNVSGVSTFQGNVNLGNNDILALGNSGLSIWWNNYANIQNNTGRLDINQYAPNENLNLTAYKTSAFLGIRVEGSTGEAQLYHLGNKKLNTTGIGVSIYDNLNVGTAVTVYGNAGIVSAISFYGDGSNLTNTGATLSAAAGTQRLVLTSLTSGTMVDAATDGDLSFTAETNELAVPNLNVGTAATISALSVTGVSTFQAKIEGAATNNVIPFLYANYSDLPNAGTYHGAFAHVHATGKAYFAHANAWYELVNKDLNGVVGTGTETYNVANINITGITTLGGPVTAGSSEGVAGQYLRHVGTGVTWANFPTLRTTQTFTALAGQTTFNFTYNVDFLDVYVNGVKLSPSEYTATNGSDVVLDIAAFAGDTVELYSYNTASTYGGGGGSSYTDANVNTHLNVSGASAGEILSWNGSDYAWVADQTGGGGVGVNTSQFNVNNLHVGGISTFTSRVIFDEILEFRGLEAGGANTLDWYDAGGVAKHSIIYNGTNFSIGGGEIVEIDSSDSLVIANAGTGIGTFTEHGLNLTGIVTATSFEGSAASLTGLTGAAANTYGNATSVPQIVVDANGKITGITNVLISGGGGGGTSIIVQDSQSLVGAAGTIDFGTGLSVSPVSAGIVTVTGSGISLTDLSITTNTAGTAALSYNNSNGVFTYTPPDLSSYLTSYTESDPVVAAVNGIVKSDGSTISAATAGTDYLAPGSEFTSQWTFSASGASNYQVTGPGFAANSADPTIYVMRGHKYKFTNNAGSHPLQIQYEFENASGTAYTDGVTNNSNVITWEVRNDTPDLLHYQCTSHDGMSGRIVVLGDVVTTGEWTASAGTAQTIDTITGVSNNAIKTAEYTVHIENGSNMQSQKVLVMQNGTTAYSQEYAIMFTSTNPLVTITADINSGNLRLLATPSTGVTGDTTYTLTRQTIR